MARKTIQTVSDSFVAKVNWLYDRLRRMNQNDVGTVAKSRQQEPDDLIVGIGSGGIPARSGNNVYGVLCDTYTLTGDVMSGSMTLSPVLNGNGSPYQVMVYNLVPAAVEGPKKIVTSRLKAGVRYVVVEACDIE